MKLAAGFARNRSSPLRIALHPTLEPLDLVSAIGQLLATRRGDNDAGSNGVDLSEKQENTPHPARLDRWKRWWAGNAAVRRSMTPSALRGFSCPRLICTSLSGSITASIKYNLFVVRSRPCTSFRAEPH